MVDDVEDRARRLPLAFGSVLPKVTNDHHPPQPRSCSSQPCFSTDTPLHQPHTRLRSSSSSRRSRAASNLYLVLSPITLPQPPNISA